MRIGILFRFVAIVLFLSISSCAFAQKVQIKIEGNGAVCVQDKLFSGKGLYEFEVEKGIDTLHFQIKPGKQFYLDSLLNYSWGEATPISRDSIYAERDDTLHYFALRAEGFVLYHFVFKEIQPWNGGIAEAYRSKDKSYVQIYRPEELFGYRSSSVASLQNDIDLAHTWLSNNKLRADTLQGNNKIISNGSGDIFLYVEKIMNLHFVCDRNDNPVQAYGASLEGITVQGRISALYTIYEPDEPLFIRDFINFGYGSGCVFIPSKSSKNIINWGRFDECLMKPWHEMETNACFYDNISVSYVFNFGRVPKLVPEEDSCMRVSSYFNDKNLVPDVELPEWAKGYNLESRQLIDSAFMRSLMGDSAAADFIFEDGFYPRLRHMDECPGRLAASPILLYPGESADSVTLPFYVDTNYGVRWSVDELSTFLDIVRIEGNFGYVQHPVKKTFTVQMEARRGDFRKYVYLTVPASRLVYQDLNADTVCPCDSVKMINTYARNEGWNYEVVENGREDTYDTIYRMYLHHYPTYREVVHRAAVERDSLPYIYGNDTIRNFGLTEVRRHQTVHGCDSILYVQLDTLYVHRERHFRDSLHTCAGDTLYWRGHEITQTGQYTDTVFDPYKGGTDSIHHLWAALHPTYHATHTDSCYIEELPYGMDGRQVPDFGHHTDRHVTVLGCDSVHEYSLSRRWHHYRVQVRVRGNGRANLTDTTVREDGQVRLRFTAATCHVLDSLRIDGRPVAPNMACLLENLRGDCLVEAVFSETAPAESVLRYEVCADSLPVRYHGEAYGAGEHEIRFTSAAGCDSIVRLNVREKRNTARIAVTDTITPPCGAAAIPVSYRVETGSPQRVLFRYDAAAHAAGFRDTTVDIRGGGERKTDLPLPPDARPDRYSLQLWQADATGCHVQDAALTFEIPYPSTIIVQKWDDVLAVLSAEYNGGYEFSAYQWYADGEPIAGETRPYLYHKPYLPSTSRYSVLLERIADGLRLMSCPVKRQAYPRELTLELRPNPAGQGGEVEVRVGGKPEAEGTVEVFDNTGRPVYSRPFLNGVHTLRVNWQPGTYVVRVRGEKPAWTASGKLLVL